MRILSIGHADSPQFVERTSKLRSIGHVVVELTGMSTPVVDDGPHQPVKGFETFSWRLTALSRVVLFLRAVSRLKPDLILVHYAQGVWAWLAPLCRAPLVVSVMGGDVLFDEQGAPSACEREATLEVLRKADVLLCKSPYLAEEASRLLQASKGCVCGWGTEEAVFCPGESSVRLDFGVGKDDTLIFSPRGMQPLYRIETIIEAFAKAELPGPKWLGVSTHRSDKKYEHRVRNLAHRLGVADSVFFLPPLGKEEMAAWYRASDMCVSVPESDGLPQTFLEAAACEVPMIMSDLPNYSDIIVSGESALLVDGSVDSLTEAMGTLGRDYAMRRNLRVGARKWQRKYDADSAVALNQALQDAAACKREARTWADLAQVGRILWMLACGRPIVARTGQPVYDSFKKYFFALIDAA